MANLPPVLKQYWTDSNGDPLAGGKIYTYQAGTSIPQATYTDSGGGTENANPVVLDASGYAAMWLDPELSYKFVIKDSDDNLLHTIDNVVGLLTADAVSTASLQDGAVTTAKLADDAVTADKLKDSASVDADRPVNTDNVRDGAITRAKLAAGAIGKLDVKSKTAAYTLVATTDDMILADASGGDFTLTLPAASGLDGKRFWIKNIGSSGTVTIDGNASETIEGSSTYLLTGQYDMVTIMSDGTNWTVISYETSSYKAATSATEAAANSGNYNAFTGSAGEVTLTPGVWRVDGKLIIARTSGTNGLTESRAYWCSAEGGDSATQPTLITATSGVTVLSGQALAIDLWTASNGGADGIQMPVIPLRLLITQTITLYLVPLLNYSSGAWENSVSVWAEKIK